MVTHDQALTKKANPSALARTHHEPGVLDDRGLHVLDVLATLVVAKLLDRLPALLATEGDRLAYNLD